MKLLTWTCTAAAAAFPGVLETARGRVRQRRFQRLAVTDGAQVGLGEAAAWPGFGSAPASPIGDEDTGDLASTLERLDDTLGEALVSLGPALEALLPPLDAAGCSTAAASVTSTPELRFAIELALLDLLARRAGRPLARFLEPSAAPEAETHLLVHDAETARSARRDGATRLKVKLVGRLDADLARVAAVRAAAPDLRLRLDANGGFDPESARAFLAALPEAGIDWLEQPLDPARPDALVATAALARESAIPIALDESLVDEAAVAAALQLGAASVFVLKPMFCGGFAATRALVESIRAAGRRALLTHALESGIGRTATAHYAAALAPLGLEPGGLAGALDGDIAGTPERRGSRLRLSERPGLGLELGPSAVATPLAGRTT